MRKIYLFSLFTIFAPLTLFVAIFCYFSIVSNNSAKKIITPEVKVLGTEAPLELYLSMPTAISTIEQEIQTGDARPVLIRQYLEKYQSPLLPYSDFLFQVSQKYGLDHGLILAIAQCESNVCKKIPEGSYNCWGFGNGETRFKSWEEAIEFVAKTLKEDYYDKGLVTPEQMMPKYVPPSVAKGGPWAKCVNEFLQELH